VDGIVIATPSALHAEQAIRALEAGAAVFCQKPLGRTADEARAIVEAARKADRLLAADLSYRFTAGMQKVRELVRSGDLGRVFAADLVFHNAYGPDKPWFYDVALSGGGCVMDLGVHLIDLALWTLDFPAIREVSARLRAGGEPLKGRSRVEDYAIATIELEMGTVVRIACSWRLPAGCDAVIGATFYGTEGSAQFHNDDGSFYDFTARHCRGTQRFELTRPPDAWGGRAAVDWTARLAAGSGFDPEVKAAIDVAATIDRIYEAAARP
jgi:predicted dehydrogenase